MDKKQENDYDYDYLLKFVVIGDKKSGKSTFINQLVLQKFTTFYNPTVGIEFASSYSKFTSIDKIIKTTSWDIAGSRDFIRHIESYFKNITFALLFIDLTKSNAMESLDFWYNVFKEKTKNKDIPCFIMASHYDKYTARQISLTELKMFCNEKNCSVVEIDNTNTSEVHDMFRHIIEDVLNKLSIDSDMYCHRPSKKAKTKESNGYFQHYYCNIL